MSFHCTPKQLARQQRHIFVHELLGASFSMYNNFMDIDAEVFKSEANRFSALALCKPRASLVAHGSHKPIEIYVRGFILGVNT